MFCALNHLRSRFGGHSALIALKHPKRCEDLALNPAIPSPAFIYFSGMRSALRQRLSVERRKDSPDFVRAAADPCLRSGYCARKGSELYAYEFGEKLMN